MDISGEMIKILLRVSKSRKFLVNSEKEIYSESSGIL